MFNIQKNMKADYQTLKTLPQVVTMQSLEHFSE